MSEYFVTPEEQKTFHPNDWNLPLPWISAFIYTHLVAHFWGIDDNNTYIIGKYGPVIKCVEEKDGKEEVIFKPIKKDLDIKKLENGEYELNDIYSYFKNDWDMIETYKTIEILINQNPTGSQI